MSLEPQQWIELGTYEGVKNFLLQTETDNVANLFQMCMNCVNDLWEKTFMNDIKHMKLSLKILGNFRQSFKRIRIKGKTLVTCR